MITMIKRLLVVFAILLNTNLHAQFDSLIFSKGMRLNPEAKSIYALGDQNKDGIDDIMLYDCSDERGYIYFGGSPMDTISENNIRFYDSIYTSGPSRVPGISIIDINDDSVNDIIVTSIYLSDSGYYSVGPIRVYYGGNVIDSIPDLVFNLPQGTSGASGQVLKDFNGDGRNELVIYDVMITSTTDYFGRLYFYNTESQFDTIPHYVITGDSINKIRIGSIGSSGDINGDGKTDFTIYGSEGESTGVPPPPRFFRSFYLGNENFDLEPAVTYYRDARPSIVEYMEIINDINGDGRDDILTIDNGYYPWYYLNAILYGNFPIDTIPDVGLNTQYEGLNFAQIYSLGDVNGDSYNDFFSQTLIFGDRNIKLWLGGKNMPGTINDIANRTWAGTSSGFGRILGAVGDVDGDGINDIAIGQILYGAQPDDDCNTGWIYIIKGDTSIVTSIEDNEVEIPELYKIEEPYPNPFNPTTKIKYTISNTAKVKIKLFDSLGKEIRIILNEEQKKGEYETEINTKDLSSGIYFVQFRFTAGENRAFQETKKIILTK